MKDPIKNLIQKQEKIFDRIFCYPVLMKWNGKEYITDGRDISVNIKSFHSDSIIDILEARVKVLRGKNTLNPKDISVISDSDYDTGYNEALEEEIQGLLEWCKELKNHE